MNLWALTAGILAASVCAPAAAGQDGRYSGPRDGTPPARLAGHSAVGAQGVASDVKMRGRMTPDERRQLRADVFDANRNVYSAERAAEPRRRRSGP